MNIINVDSFRWLTYALMNKILITQKYDLRKLLLEKETHQNI